LNRITRWNQDLIRDDWGKWLYLRDLDSGELKSLAYQPVQAAYDKYVVRHGLGYSTFEQHFEEIHTTWTIFPTKEDPVEIWICTLKNNGAQKRRFQLVSYFEWNVGASPDNRREFHKLFIETKYEDTLQTILTTKNLWEVSSDRGHWNTDWPFIGFHAVDNEISGWDTNKDSLIGRLGSFHNPKGIKEGKFTQTSGRFQDSVASLATNVELDAGEQKTIVFVLGAGDKKDGFTAKGDVEFYVQKYCIKDTAFKELQKVKDFWKEFTSRVNVETPDSSFNLLSNIWLKYQVISSHLWARTGYYQQSGSYGYRDQLQASQVWLPHDPPRMLEQAKLNARHQFQKGTVLHWWNPITEEGLATNMTDDLLWLPFMLTRYFNEVGDFSALDEIIPYYDKGEGTLQQHCTRAIDVVLERFSEHGLPLIGEGDWCDGFSAVGLAWKGESIWLGMFLYDVLISWSEILCVQSPSPDHSLAAHYRERAEHLKTALNTHGWNGQWYFGATKDDGTPIGDPSQDECNIYLMSQTWAIISGVAEGERRETLLKVMLENLESENGLQLLYPAFKKPDRYIGYITRYAPGLRENGGVYTHAAVWGVLALTKMGMADDAIRIFNKLNPILQTTKDVNRYFGEPYVLPGNIDGKDSEHYGRAGWTWYTGSAGWLFSIAHEAICGVRPVPSGLMIDPCIPRDWSEIRIHRKFRGADFDISIKNPNSLSGGVKEILLNGHKIEGNIIPPQLKGTHKVDVVLTE
jgi:cellobiose phosphorylase